MDVVDAQAAWLSNFEVLEHLKAQKALREASKKGRPLQAAENVQTVEFETLGYFEADAAVNALTAAKLEELLGYFRPLALTKAEKLQLVNMLPKTEVEFYLIVEECEERFKPEEVEAILGKIAEITSSA